MLKSLLPSHSILNENFMSIVISGTHGEYWCFLGVSVWNSLRFLLTCIYFHYFYSLRLLNRNHGHSLNLLLPHFTLSFYHFQLYDFRILQSLFIIIYIRLPRIMNLLKGFGGSGSSVASMGASKPLGTKNSYFSTLKLQQDQPAGKEKSKDPKKSDHKKGPPKDFIPNKFALSFDPPTIIFEYKNPQNNKLYHHKMRVKKLKKDTNTKDALDFLRKKHSQYFAPKVIDQGQIQKLIQKLKMGMAENKESQMENVQEQDDFEFDYDDDFEDL